MFHTNKKNQSVKEISQKQTCMHQALVYAFTHRHTHTQTLMEVKIQINANSIMVIPKSLFQIGHFDKNN